MSLKPGFDGICFQKKSLFCASYRVLYLRKDIIKVFTSFTKNPHDLPYRWRKEIGQHRNPLIDILIGDRWLDDLGDQLDINEYPGHNLWFRCTRRDPYTGEVRTTARFSIEYGYYNQRFSDRPFLRISNVEFVPRGNGSGRIFLERLALTWRFVGAGGICLTAGDDMGGWWWQRCGGLLQQWVEDNRDCPSAIRAANLFQIRYSELATNTRITPDWSEDDREWLHEFYAEKNPRRLKELVTRGLYVQGTCEGRPTNERVALDIWWLGGLRAGECYFLLNNPWTRERLPQYAHVDLEILTDIRCARPSSRPRKSRQIELIT